MLKVLQSNKHRILEGAKLLKINQHRVLDIFDYLFYNDPTKRRIFIFSIKDRKETIYLNPGEEMHLVFEEPEYRNCENDCEYCFVKGLPRGLRKELYFRDDDYRLSFLFGNFLSLTNLSLSDIKRIKKLRLSPLYVSVHSTNPVLRKKLFKNERAGLLIEQLKKLIEGNIQIHCQIVVIPGLTDGKNLTRSVHDLSELFPGVSSVGIVPLGRTKFLSHLPGVDKRLARCIVKAMNILHKNFKKKFKKGFVYLADEFFIRAGFSIPGRDYYDDFPQYENGIGMVRELLDEIDSLPVKNKISGKMLFVTGELAYPYINYLKTKLMGKKLKIDVLPVRNRFFGKTVTVSGLLVGRDIHDALNPLEKKYDRIILPPNCVNDKGEFLDDYKIDNEKIIISPYSIKELLLWLQ
ncbi:MAG: DUF512 domain-containing protein [candidate division WOR-3 bacterium]|nr:DUF512 domain-containing protein [candidate division WOR-3 bacterium]